MGNGYHSKILKVNLTEEKIMIDEKEDKFYRKYLGGPGIAAYYALKEIPQGADPLGPENALIITNSVVTGSPAPGVMRYSVSAKSPLTGAFGTSEAGGWWGPRFKKAGYDGVIIKGQAAEPTYLFVSDEEVSLKTAENLWGKTTKEVEEILQDRHGSRARVLQIGPGGENQVTYANICNDLAHFNGRNGMGAVMGSKNLKAIVAKGQQDVPCSDEQSVKDIMKWVGKNVHDHPLTSGLHETGTAGGITSVNAGGALPTNNWKENYFSDAEQIGSDALEEILINRTGCFGCPIRCKRVVEYEDEDYKIDPEYGGPEYETLGAIGSNCGFNDIKLVSKANELCNKYTIDTISFGMTLSFAMHCYEEGLLTKEDTGGFELEFGNGDVLLPLIEQTAKQEGFGKKLALGSARLAKEIGEEAKPFLRVTKNQEVPMHDPRVKTGLGLQFALSSYGGDHWVAQHDPFFTEEDSLGTQAIKPLGILEEVPAVDLSADKIRFFYYTNLLTSVYDCLGTCVFSVIARGILPLDKFMDLVEGVTGWNTSLWELMKVGERTENLMRLFNIREGFSAEDDKLPEHFFKDIKGGPHDGEKALDKEEFEAAIKQYYQMAGWDEDGKPLKAKLKELALHDEFKEIVEEYL